jgi:hypothetical protein
VHGEALQPIQLALLLLFQGKMPDMAVASTLHGTALGRTAPALVSPVRHPAIHEKYRLQASQPVLANLRENLFLHKVII